MEFEYSKKTKMYMEQVTDFMTKYIYPNEHVFHEQLTAGPTRWQIPPIMEELKATARERGIWNLFLPASVRDGDSYVINGHKWWTSGIGDPRCKILIFMGKTDARNPDRYKQQSMILVPRDTPGIKVLRMLTVFGYDDAPHGHGEVIFENVRVPASNMLLGEGRGFEIAQGRLGPGRIHHCMRQIGVAERALELMCKRSQNRVAFGKRLAENDITLERIAQSRIEIDQARLLVLHAAYMMDTVGNKAAKQAIAEIKVAVPNMTLQVVERAMQLHGGGGVSQEFPLASMWAHSRTLRFADGPDEVHRRQIGRLELRKHG